MKALLLLCTMIAILVPGIALAQIDQGTDGLGLYADPDAMINYASAGAGDILELNLMATNISSPDGIGAFELSLFWYENHVWYAGMLIPEANISIGIFPDIIVGYQTPKPFAPVMHLATISLLVTAPLPADLFIKQVSVPVGGSMGNNLPVYVAGFEPGDLRNLYPSSGSIDEPVFRINGLGPVAVTNTSLDAVKALYR